MTFCRWVVLLAVPAHLSPSAVGEAAGTSLILDADLPALVVDSRELGASAPGAGALLLLLVCSPALLALSSLLHSWILLQQGPRGKGTVNDLVIKALTPEASACHDLSCCGIEGCDVELLIKGTEWEALDHTFVPELSIIAEHGCPVEMLV